MTKKLPFKEIFNEDNPVYYQFIDNKSKKTVIFIHGLFSSSSIFRHFLQFIKYNIILVELRGIVYSKCDKPYLKNYAEDIRLILENEKIDKNVILIGYSMGCSIANEFAEKHSEMVDKVIMLAPINRTFKEIGRFNFIRSLKDTFGKHFFKRWRDYLRIEKNWPFYKLFSLFNFKLLKDVFKKLDFTCKCKIIILNGKESFLYFNKKDHHLGQPNIHYQEIEDLDHFLFLTKKRIEDISKLLIAHLNGT